MSNIVAYGTTYLVFAVRLLLPLAILPILSVRLGPEAFGTVMTAQALGLFASMVVEFGFHLSGTRQLSVAVDTEEEARVIGEIVSAQAIVSFVVAIMVVVVGRLTPSLADAPVLIATSVVLALSGGLVPVWYFRAKEKVRTSLLLEALGQLTVLVLVLAVVHTAGDRDLAGIAMALGSGVTLVTAFLILAGHQKNGIAFIGPLPAMRILSSRAPLLGFRLASAFQTLLAPWLMSLFATPTQVAFFAIASKAIGVVESTLQPAVHMALPAFARAQREPTTIRRLVWRSSLSVGTMAVPAFLVLQFGSPYLIPLLFGASFDGAVPVATQMSWICLLLGVRAVTRDLVLAARHADRTVFGIAVAGALALFTFAVLLVPSYGEGGMACAKLVSELLAAILLILFALRQP